MNLTIIFNNALIITGTHKPQHPTAKAGGSGSVSVQALAAVRRPTKTAAKNPMAVINGPVLQRKIARTSRLLETDREGKGKLYYLLGECCIWEKHMPVTRGIMSESKGSRHPWCYIFQRPRKTLLKVSPTPFEITL